MVPSVSKSDQSTGIFQLATQTDGNLVQYPYILELKVEHAYWATGTNGQGNNVSLCLDDDGHLYLLNSTGKYLSNLTQGGYPTNGIFRLMRIDADGICRLYSHNLEKNGNWLINWSSSDSKCDPKGLYGLNGFCTTVDREANCKCLPGFVRVHQGNWSSGCERNFTAESCQIKNGIMKYIILEESNTVWEDSAFSIMQQILTKEDCEAACLEDCNCEAALYKDGACRKQRLPLRFGRRVLADSNVALIKVGISTPIIYPMVREKKPQKDILIMSISLAAFGLIMLVIYGIAIYRDRVWTYKRL